MKNRKIRRRDKYDKLYDIVGIFIIIKYWNGWNCFKRICKKIVSAGYKFNFTNLINFVKKFNICDKSDKRITSDDNINYSNLVPLYNVAKSLSNACIITQRFDYLLSVFKTLKK